MLIRSLSVRTGEYRLYNAMMQNHKIEKGLCSQQLAIEAAAVKKHGGRGTAV